MSLFRYRLIVLTHGIEESLGACLASFRANVTPLPVDAYMHADGKHAYRRQQEQAVAFPEWEWRLGRTEREEGFCTSVRTAWREALHAPRDHTHVFWLEHDFRFVRPVNLEKLARAMATHNAPGGGKLAQMALMRNAANEEEIEAGGLYENVMRRDPLAYIRHASWLEHGLYFTTNPSLMPVGFMEANPWPADSGMCEGAFGIKLRQRGYTFGVWGGGETWVEHYGARTGRGY